jgi:hypothetical protein
MKLRQLCGRVERWHQGTSVEEVRITHGNNWREYRNRVGREVPGKLKVVGAVPPPPWYLAVLFLGQIAFKVEPLTEEEANRQAFQANLEEAEPHVFIWTAVPESAWLEQGGAPCPSSRRPGCPLGALIHG